MESKYLVPVIGFFKAYYDLETGKVDEIRFNGKYAFYQVFCIMLLTASFIMLISQYES